MFFVQNPSKMWILFRRSFGNLQPRKFSVQSRQWSSKEFPEWTEKPKTPPKPPEDFAKQYKRKPLYWRGHGTDAFQETNRKIALPLLAFSFVIFFTVYVYYSWYPPKLSKRIRTTPVPDMDDAHLMDYFLKENLADFDKLKIREETRSLDPYKHLLVKPEQVMTREDSKRDFRNISLKEADLLLRNEKKS